MYVPYSLRTKRVMLQKLSSFLFSEKTKEQFYNFNKEVADGSGNLKTEIKKLFETMRNVSFQGI